MYAVTSIPLVRRTRATLRKAEFGFLGVTVYTRVHTPRRWGAAIRFLRPWPDLRPGVASFFFGLRRPFRTSWLMLGMRRVMVATRGRARPGRAEAAAGAYCEVATRTGAGISAAATITSTKAKLCTTMPTGSCGI